MIELTILMPCLNESESIAFAIGEAQSFIQRSGISAEILIADNGSVDNSREIATSLGARVIEVSEKGYGNALRSGIANARGRYIIMGDCDGSYDFLNLESFVEKLREGYSLVMGNRYKGAIEKGAMPFSHRCIGVPLLSFLGRLRFNAEVGDFHCGLRGFDTSLARELSFSCEGMEFATEMIAGFKKANVKICEIPTTLRRDKRSGKPHIRTIRDGLRHLKFILKN